MDLQGHLGVIERAEGTRAWLAYLAGAAIGTLVALPILAALFGIALPGL